MKLRLVHVYSFTTSALQWLLIPRNRHEQYLYWKTAPVTMKKPCIHSHHQFYIWDGKELWWTVKEHWTTAATHHFSLNQLSLRRHQRRHTAGNIRRISWIPSPTTRHPAMRRSAVRKHVSHFIPASTNQCYDYSSYCPTWGPRPNNLDWC